LLSAAIGSFILCIAADRLMSVFFEKRKTNLFIALLSYLFFFLMHIFTQVYVYNDFLGILFNIIALFALTLNYHALFLNRVYAIASGMLFLFSTQLLIGVLFDSYVTGTLVIYDFIADITPILSSFLSLALIMLLHNFKNIRKIFITNTLYSFSILAIPISSMLICATLFMLVDLPIYIMIIIIAVIIIINLFSFYIHDSHSATYEDKINLVSTITTRLEAMLNSSPLACALIDKDFNIIEANARSLELFNLPAKVDFMARFFFMLPEKQPDGSDSLPKLNELILASFNSKHVNCEWMFKSSDGYAIPCNLTMEILSIPGSSMVIMYIQELKEIKALIEAKQRLEVLAYGDSLTDLYNRRYFMETAKQMLRNCKDNKKPFSVMMLDVDYFKKVNDTYGHAVGDEVLKILARRIKHSLSFETLAARYGGEEFIVAFPGVSVDNTEQTADRVRKHINSRPFVINHLSISITASIGVASCGDLSLEDVVKKADEAAYQAKTTGRNKVVVSR